MSDTIKITDIGWNQFVLSKLDSSEFYEGNPTVDGLRRVAQILIGEIVDSVTQVVEAPNQDNGIRATVVHTITIVNGDGVKKSFSGASDCCPINVDQKYGKYLVAMAETRAEGRALRRMLNLKTVAAEEITLSELTEQKTNEGLTNDQIKFLDVFGNRLNINLLKFIKSCIPVYNTVKDLKHSDGVLLIGKLSDLQQNPKNIEASITGYKADWRDN